MNAREASMAEARPEQDVERTGRLPPVAVVALAATGIALAGALYLIAVRGETMLIDLAGMARTMLCL